MATVADELAEVPLFSGLSGRQLKRLARDFSERSFRPGTTVVRQGKMSGVGFFIVVDGEAAVSVDGTEAARLGPGDHFGELGLVNERARMATVTAVTDLRCLVMAFWDFRSFVKGNPDVAWKLLEHVVGLLVQERDRRAKAALATS
jgi:CRP/FNR family transcriptional regulator, cyclic AMP receptor protein